MGEEKNKRGEERESGMQERQKANDREKGGGMRGESADFPRKRDENRAKKRVISSKTRTLFKKSRIKV